MEVSIDLLRRHCGDSRVLSVLLVVNIGMSLLLMVSEGVWQGEGPDLPLRFGLSSDIAKWLSHPWTLLTYMVTQFSMLHLLVNMLWLWWFGKRVVKAEGEKGLLVSYIGGGIAGGLVYLLVSLCSIGEQRAYLCGASASVLALMGMVMTARPGETVRLPIAGQVRMIWVALGCVALCFASGSKVSTGAQVAHLGGLAFGLGYGLIKNDE